MSTFLDIVYHPQRIEREIDQGRLHAQWPTVLKLLEKLAHTCDLGAAQLNVDAKLRNFYWTVMAEYLMEHRRDYAYAMTCIRKSVELDKNATEWRIIFVRLLLTWTKCIVLPGTITDEGTIVKEKKSKRLNATEVLSDVLKVFC